MLAALACLSHGPAAFARIDTVPLPDRKPQAGLPLPDRNPLRNGEQPPVPPPHPREVQLPDWTDAEIEAARLACAALLKSVKLSYAPLAPVREGRCGAPYPISVSSIGQHPAVEISPPATLTCRMAAGLARWLGDTVQPRAREHFKSAVVRMRNVASYVCRNRYNNSNARISEHAFANAIDVAAFTLDSGATVTVLDRWPRKHTGITPIPPAAAPTPPEAAPASANGRDKPEANTPPRQIPQAPPAEPRPTAEQAPPKPEALFLKALHEGACRTFGTVIGPDANDAHNDHFHLDMKARTYGAYCE